MDFVRFITQLIIISCVPLIHYALSKNLNLRDVKKARWHFIAVFIIMSFLTFIGSNGSGESFLAIVISLFIYVFYYKRLIRNKYEPKIVDFDSFDHYIAALAKKRNIKYPLPQTILALHGLVPKIEDYETIPDWTKALKQYFDDIEST